LPFNPAKTLRSDQMLAPISRKKNMHRSVLGEWKRDQKEKTRVGKISQKKRYKRKEG